MKRPLRAVICLALIMCLMAGLSGCTTYNNFKAAFFPSEETVQGQTIKIGIYESLTGKNSEQGKAETIGIELANELYGTVLGKTVELIYGDNQSSMYVGETVIQELLSQSPALVLGSYGETVTLVASHYLKAVNVPGITISSTNPFITTNNDYYFTATFTETKQGDALATFTYKKQDKSLVATVCAYNDEAATATIKRFTNKMKSLTGDDSCVVGSFSLLSDVTDYTNIIEAIIESEAEAVFLDISPTLAESFLSQAIELGLTDVLFLGIRDWDDESLLAFVAEHEELEIAYPSDFSQVVTTDMSAIFLDAYKEKYGEDAEPSEATAIAFDAYLLALQAIEDAYEAAMTTTAEDLEELYESDATLRAAIEDLENTQETGMPSGRQIKAALTAIKNFEGASGIISYNGSNEASKTITINYIIGSAEAEIYTID